MTKGTELKFNLQGLSVAGFVLPNGRKPTKIRWGWFFLVQFPYFLIHLLAMLEFVFKPFQLRRTIVTLFLANNGFQTTFRPFHMMYFKKQLEEMLSAIDTPPDSESEEFNELERGMRAHSRKRILRFSTILYCYNAIVFTGIAVPALIRTIKVMYCDDKRELNLEFCEHESTPLLVYDFWWFNYDPLKPPTFYYAYFYNVLMTLVYLLIFCTSDAFTCSVMVAVAERCKFLVRTAPEALKPDENGQITPFCKAWIKYHQHYELLVRMVNTILGPVVFVTHVFAALNVMAYSFILIKDDVESVKRMAGTSLVGLAIQFYLFAYAGQQIINKSDELSRATLTAAQVASGSMGEGPARSVLTIVMAKCCGQKSEEITGLGYFTISMRFYARIISLSASYLLFMLQIQ